MSPKKTEKGLATGGKSPRPGKSAKRGEAAAILPLDRADKPARTDGSVGPPMAKLKMPRTRVSKSRKQLAVKIFVDGLHVRGEVAPVGRHPSRRKGVTHVELPDGSVERVAFSAY